MLLFPISRDFHVASLNLTYTANKCTQRSRRETYQRKKEDKFSWKQSYTHKSTYHPHYKIYLLFKAARWKITGKVLDKIKQQLISISAIQFVFSFKPLISTFFNAHFLPAHHHFKGATTGFILRRFIWLQHKISPFPSNFQTLSWGCCHLSGTAKQAAPAFLLPYFIVPLDQEHTSCWLHLLPFNSALQGNRCISIMHTYVTTCHPGRIHRVQLIHSTVLPLAARQRGAGGKQEYHLCFEGQRYIRYSSAQLEQQWGMRLSWNPQSTHRHFSKNWTLSLLCPHHTYTGQTEPWWCGSWFLFSP